MVLLVLTCAGGQPVVAETLQAQAAPGAAMTTAAGTTATTTATTTANATKGPAQNAGAHPPGRGRLAWRLLALGVGGAAGWAFVRLGRSASGKPRDGAPD